ncbi:MAG TPA: SGNH/GDSL hydrolase family protein [Acidimicrobiales bacterium]|nr:SGNH/GDSL hydrolase family protein [Acidimicrobiales bacterium]
MSIRPEQPEPFLRGCVFPAVTGAPYPRADPAGSDYLPADVWAAAQLPVGVRLELVGNARTIRVWYETTRASLGYRGESAGCSFVAYRAGQKVAVAEAVMGEGMAELVMTGRPDLPVTVYLPEGMVPLVTGVAGVEDTMVPAPLQPRWLAYGDAVTQGWLASSPAMAWPAVAGRKLGLDVCNLGYAGTARGETTSALMLAETPAEVISIAFGLNNWSRVPHTPTLMAEEVRCFLSLVRQGHPETPVVVVSPTARPDAEDEPNRVGATLAQLRRAMEQTVRTHIENGDENLFLVEGLAVVDPDDLEDGVYPGDEGHRRLAAAVGKCLVPRLADLRAAAEKRWAAEGISPITIAIPVPLAYPEATVPPASDPSTPSPEPDPLVSDQPVSTTAIFDISSIDDFDFGVDGATADTDLPEFSLSDGARPPDETPEFDLSEFTVHTGALADVTVPEIASSNGVTSDPAPITAIPNFDDPFAEDPLADELFAENRFAEAGFTEVELAQVGFTEEGLAEDGFTEVELAEHGFIEDGFTKITLAEDGLVQDGLAEVAASAEAEMAEIGDPEVDAESGHDVAVEEDVLTSSVEAPTGDETTSAPTSADSDTRLSSVNGSAGSPVDGSVVTDGRDTSASDDVVDGQPFDDTQATNQPAPRAEIDTKAAPPEVKKPIRRDRGPVDIAVADMVVAALSLATNGADDEIRRVPITEDELHWVDAVDPTAY